jgi:hypothetical protein
VRFGWGLDLLVVEAGGTTCEGVGCDLFFGAGGGWGWNWGFGE